MCDPFTIAATAISAAGSMVSANAQSQAMKYQAKVDEMNARIEDKRAVDAIERGQKEEQLQRREVSAFMAKQTAAQAAAGLDVGYGSPLQTIVDTAVLGELDAMQIRKNAEIEAYDRKVGAANYRASADMNRAGARNAMIGGFFDAAGTIVGGAGQAWKNGGGTFRKASPSPTAGATAPATTTAAVGGQGTSAPLQGTMAVNNQFTSIGSGGTGIRRPRKNPFKVGNRYTYSMGH